MSVDPREIECHNYILSIKDIEEFAGLGLYNLDTRRTELHEKLSKSFGLSVEETKSITDNLDLSNYRVATDLYCDLLDLSRKKDGE